MTLAELKAEIFPSSAALGFRMVDGYSGPILVVRLVRDHGSDQPFHAASLIYRETGISRLTAGARTSVGFHVYQQEPASLSLAYWARATTAEGGVVERHDSVLEFEAGRLRYAGEYRMLTRPWATQSFECGNRP